MSNIAELIQEEIKPFVQFKRIAVEDKAESLRAGHYVAKDVDYAFITPPYSKDVMKYKVTAWFAQLDAELKIKRVNQQWVDDYHKAYEFWLKGQELPLDGIPIKGWGVIGPAQQETLTKLHILTVEQLAAANDEGVRRIGMGGMELKNKAQAWLKSLKKSGALSIEMAALQRENESLKASLELMQNKIDSMTKNVNVVHLNSQEIGFDDIIGTD